MTIITAIDGLNEVCNDLNNQKGIDTSTYIFGAHYPGSNNSCVSLIDVNSKSIFETAFQHCEALVLDKTKFESRLLWILNEEMHQYAIDLSNVSKC